MVSTTEPGYHAHLVRLRHGDSRPGAPGLREAVVDSLGRHPGRVQTAATGSCVLVAENPRIAALTSFTLRVWLWPTTPLLGREQGVLSSMTGDRPIGWALFLNEFGRLALRIGDGSSSQVSTGPRPLRERTWYVVCATFDARTGRADLVQRAADGWASDPTSCGWHDALVPGPPGGAGDLLLGAMSCIPDSARRTWGHGHLNGKLESPALYGAALAPEEVAALVAGDPPSAVAADRLVADWDLGAEPAGSRVLDRGPFRLHGRTVNLPSRAATGHLWAGDAGNFRVHGLDAIHFHEDDLEDAAWQPDFTVVIPHGLHSGVYAVRLTAGELVDHVPLFVRPRRGTNSPAVALLLPTFTYLAYGNSRVQMRTDFVHSGVIGRATQPDPLDLWLNRHPELGLSLYDRHSDGSGSCYASRRRPLTNLRPQHINWMTGAPRHFPADLYIVDWLDEQRIPYDVLTDEDLHHEGVELISAYRAVITGTHPEYASGQMLTALEAYTAFGGRLVCLGANCFYWVTSVDPDRPHVIEVRRGHSGTRPWESEAGESRHSTTGETGGLWRHRGRPPNRLLGAGFTAQGWDEKARGYRRTTASRDPRFAWIFRGVEEEIIGDFGLVMDGAAGDEMDRVDPARGSPPGTVVLASSADHSDSYFVAVEDVLSLRPGLSGGSDERVRADMAYHETDSGGAVFTVSSICWAGSLSHAGYDNNVSRVTRNVLDGFLAARLPGGDRA